MKNIIAAVLVFAILAVPSLAWFDTGYPFRAVDTINYTGSTTLAGFTYPVNSTSFDVGGVDSGPQTVWVKAPLLNPGINTQFLYYVNNYNYTSVNGNDTSVNGMEVDIGNSSNVSSAWDSSYHNVWHMTANGDDGFGNFLIRDQISGNDIHASLGVFPFDIFGSPVGNSAFFGTTVNGVNYGFLPNPPVIANNNPFTIEALVKLTSLNSENPIIQADNIPDSQLSYELYYGGSPGYCNTTDQFAFAINSLFTPGTITCATGTIPGGIQTGVWYYLAATDDGSSIKLYINGALINSSSYTEGYWYPDTNDNFGFNDLTTNILEGYIDEASISDPRSDDWILARNASLMGRFSLLGPQQLSPPSLNITIQSPNGTYQTTSPALIDLNFTIQGSPDNSSCSYMLDGAGNVSIPGCSNTAVNVTFGSHTVVVFANDSVQEVTFSSPIASFTTESSVPPVPGPEQNISFLLELIAGVTAAGWIVVLSRLAFEDLQEENYTGLWKLVIIAFIGITMIGVLFAVIQGLI